MDIKLAINTLRQSGYLAWEYNPLHNYQTEEDLFLINNEYLVPKGMAVNPNNGELLHPKYDNYLLKYVDKKGKIIENAIAWNDINYNILLYAKAGSVIDFDTDKLNFDLEHPVDITVLPSYDGSVNLILNDDKNIPRLINSRFSVREKNTYEIVDRVGENDTNIYNSKTFDKDTSLYFQYESNPSISYEGFVKGRLQVGQYCFYFTYCDADDNESDYIAETGLIPVFLGNDVDPDSMDGGIKNLQTDKGIKLKLENIDKSYNYFKIYYVRYFADYQQNRVYECKKILQRYAINSNDITVQITGNENYEDLDANILNLTRFNPKSVLTQAQCKNMLFFGNIVKNSDNYKELSDCALRICPKVVNKSFSLVDDNYSDTSGDFGYYNSKNIYNSVGYFNKEYYRFGVVFIYNNGTLSNVYNTLGCTINETGVTYEQGHFLVKESENDIYLYRKYFLIDENGWIKNTNGSIIGGNYLNARGVCKIQTTENYNNAIGIEFSIPEEVSNFLKDDMGIRGLFFVRLKCIPTILGQCLVLPMDEESESPVLKIGDKYITETFLSKDLKVTNTYSSRLYSVNTSAEESSISSKQYAGICPDFLLNLPYYNQIFNSSNFRLEKITNSNNDKLVNSSGSRFYNYKPDDGNIEYDSILKEVTICTVTEDVPSVAIKDKVYKLEKGQCEESFRFVYAFEDYGTYDAGKNAAKLNDKAKKAYNLLRGNYSPFLAIYSDTSLEVNCIYNIYLNNLISERQEYLNRMNSVEPFYAISDRFNFNQISENKLICFRGDCYINKFTFRLNRNFNDPSLPNNDVIIDLNTWKDNYDPQDLKKWTNISRSDLNAVQMGSWITFPVKSAMNYALRSEDHSYVSEEALMGSPRSYVPRKLRMWRGNHKIPDSYLYNDAYRATLGFKCYFAVQDVNYIKDTFSNRIQYSALSIQDSYKNNYRYSLSTYHKDYSQEYGGITKLIGLDGYLLVVFEHAIAIAPINERVLAGGGEGDPVFINTQNVLPDELTVITDTHGSQWGDSIIKTEANIVYGVDTITKKIWRVSGQSFEILSDMKMNKFLIDNISLGERELYPYLGLKNVKTHYNNNKKDVMFTFYDDIYKDEEKVWNLCYNELIGEFITFYSWVPSFSENIDTLYFTFNRQTSKELALLRKCNYQVPENTGLLVDIPILKNISEPNETPVYATDLKYIIPLLSKVIISSSIEGKPPEYTETEEHIELTNVSYILEKDHWRNDKLFRIDKNLLILTESKLNVLNLLKERNTGVILLEITPMQEKLNKETEFTTQLNFKTETIAVTFDEIVSNKLLTDEDKALPSMTTDFYLHGRTGIFNLKESFKPTYWYGEQHPFEFEFVVNDKVGQQKIFTNLVLISNKAEPESFHFEIEGDNYDFSMDKRNMYVRQEATKEVYLNLGSDILYDRYYKDVAAWNNMLEQHFRKDHADYPYTTLNNEYGLIQQVKSSIFPLYYKRRDSYNDIYHIYELMRGDKYDFLNLSGSEVKWNKDLNQFNVITHIKNSPVDLVGRIRGNSQYKEGKWNIQIPSIIFNLKNEDKWPINEKGESLPPIVINELYIPDDLESGNITSDILPNIYSGNPNKYIETSTWSRRKETKIRDKWIKIRVRYSGKNLAIVHSIITLYNISYS